MGSCAGSNGVTPEHGKLDVLTSPVCGRHARRNAGSVKVLVLSRQGFVQGQFVQGQIRDTKTTADLANGLSLAQTNLRFAQHANDLFWGVSLPTHIDLLSIDRAKY